MSKRKINTSPQLLEKYERLLKASQSKEQPLKDEIVRMICERCGSVSAVRISYGYPSLETRQKAREGKAVLGGCVIMPGRAKFACTRCGYKW
jgi:hypothetical protein